MDLNLRRAIPADAPGLAEIHVAAWQKAYPGIVPDSHLKAFTVERRTERFREALENGTEETYLVELDGRAIGILTLGDCRDADLDPRVTGEIWGIYLSPQYWRKGIGRLLFEKAEKMLADRGHKNAKLWVLEKHNQARQFYEAMGFKTDGMTKEMNLGATLRVVRYHKSLMHINAKIPPDS
jgi:GNAT superfamily N-acetyltransferase